MRRAWSVAAALPRIAAIATATPVAYSSRRFTTRTVASWSSIGVERSSTLPETSGTATSAYGLSRRSTRPRAMRESWADWRPTESSLMEPALAAESASARIDRGSGPKTW